MQVYSHADSIRTWMVRGLRSLHYLLLNLFLFMSLDYCADDVLPSFQLEMKQRYLVGKMNIPYEKEGIPDEVTMDTLGEE